MSKIVFNDEAYELFERAVNALEGVFVTIDQTNGGPKVHGTIIGSNPDGHWGDEILLMQKNENGDSLFGTDDYGQIPCAVRVRKMKVH